MRSFQLTMCFRMDMKVFGSANFSRLMPRTLRLTLLGGRTLAADELADDAAAVELDDTAAVELADGPATVSDRGFITNPLISSDTHPITAAFSASDRTTLGGEFATGSSVKARSSASCNFFEGFLRSIACSLSMSLYLSLSLFDCQFLPICRSSVVIRSSF